MAADVGSQTVSLIYHAPGNVEVVNLRFVGVRPTGIYSGGYLSVVDAAHCQLSTLICEISDGTYQVKIQTGTTVNLVAAAATPYVILRWAHDTDQTNDYMSITTTATPQANDLVVGRCLFTGGGALNGFDYVDASYPRSIPADPRLWLKPETTGEVELRIRIRGGYVQGNSGSTLVPDQKSNLFVPPVATSKIYLVYIDPDDGTVAIDSTGIEAASPVAPDYYGKLVLAEVTLTAGDTSIPTSKIRDVRSVVSSGRPEVDNATVQYSVDNVLQVKFGGIGYEKMKDVYDSGWFAVVKASQYTKIHNLGSIALQVDVLFAKDAGGAPDLTSVMKVQFWHDYGATLEIGPSVQNITPTQLTVYTGAYSAGCPVKADGTVDLTIKSGWYRVLAVRIA